MSRRKPFNWLSPRVRSRRRHDLPGRSLRSLQRRLHFEPLEDRRLLAIIADTFADSFAQAYSIEGNEVTVLTADAAGHSQIFYKPNNELGYVDPKTGDLLMADFFSGTQSVAVIDAVVKGNVSQFVGFVYTNGQPIAADGGNTVYHFDGSIMRSGGTWTYDAGASLKAGDNFNWSNGNAMIAAATLRHPNGGVLRSGTSLFYATGNTFQSGTSLFYPGGTTLRSAAGDHNYENGKVLEAGSVIRYPNAGNTVMVEANGTVRNENGDLSITPFTRHHDFGGSETLTNVANASVESDTTVTVTHDIGGGSYVTRFDVVYQALPPDPTGITVTYIDDQTLYFSWTSGGGSTAGYRVAVANGASAPGDATSGVDTTNTYYVASGLTPGEKVSIRVAAKDGAGVLSDGVISTGLAGAIEQAPQTGALIESAIAVTFVQAYDSVERNVVYTVDQSNNFFVFYRPNETLGYINPENGDRLEFVDYEIPRTDFHPIPDIDDARIFSNVADIPSGAKYANGTFIRNGDTYYYEDGSVLKSGDDWFYDDGSNLRVAGIDYWDNTNVMRNGDSSFYPNGTQMKSASIMRYESGNFFLSSANSFYPNGITLRSSPGEVFYENGTIYFASNTFRYLGGATMINSAGAPFFTNGQPGPIPFEEESSMTISRYRVRLGVDEVTRYAIVILGTTRARHVLGGQVDYSEPPPPNPTTLMVQDQGPDSVTFSFASGGGSTVDYVAAWDYGSTAPYTATGGIVVNGSPLTITGLTPESQIAVRLFARNSEGELSGGATIVVSTTPSLLGDYDRNNTVDAADYVLWRKTLGTTGVLAYSGADGNGDREINDADYGVWRANFGQTVGNGTGVQAAVDQAVPDIWASGGGGDQAALEESDVLGSQAQPDLLGVVQRAVHVTPFGEPQGVSPALIARSKPAAARLAVARKSGHRDDALVAWLESQNRTLRNDSFAADAITLGDKNNDGTDEAFESLAVELGDL